MAEKTPRKRGFFMTVTTGSEGEEQEIRGFDRGPMAGLRVERSRDKPARADKRAAHKLVDKSRGVGN